MKSRKLVTLDWLARHTPNESKPFVSQNNIFVPPLHVKLGLVKKYVFNNNNNNAF